MTKNLGTIDHTNLLTSNLSLKPLLHRQLTIATTAPRKYHSDQNSDTIISFTVFAFKGKPPMPIW